MNTTYNKSNQNQQSLKYIIPLSFKEEVGNSVSHGVATLLFIFLLPFTAIYMYINGGLAHAFGGSVYVISTLMMFLSSTIYHVMAPGTHHKYVMRLIDHSCIYIAIAGTYTPIAISVIGGFWGFSLIGLQWGATILGVLYKTLSPKVSPKISLAFYLIMGWMLVPFIPFIIIRTNVIFILMILVGGILYTIGAWFYTQKDRKYYHMIWHFFIILASLAHYIGIVFFIK